ncbi:hypothetical protein [Streptomyces glaucescens]|uniref:hypothetical protein n=1 Tax=Streptomyces glaucescens TaxID=1907 RepID=UPI0005BBB6BD|nr:hypothetical protein [Streptomyces glaucescens]
MDVTLSELAVEAFFPMDEETDGFLRYLATASGPYGGGSERNLSVVRGLDGGVAGVGEQVSGGYGSAAVVRAGEVDVLPSRGWPFVIFAPWDRA